MHAQRHVWPCGGRMMFRCITADTIITTQADACLSICVCSTSQLHGQPRQQTMFQHHSRLSQSENHQSAGQQMRPLHMTSFADQAVTSQRPLQSLNRLSQGPEARRKDLVPRQMTRLSLRQSMMAVETTQTGGMHSMTHVMLSLKAGT